MNTIIFIHSAQWGTILSLGPSLLGDIFTHSTIKRCTYSIRCRSCVSIIVVLDLVEEVTIVPTMEPTLLGD